MMVSRQILRRFQKVEKTCRKWQSYTVYQIKDLSMQKNYNLTFLPEWPTFRCFRFDLIRRFFTNRTFSSISDGKIWHPEFKLITAYVPPKFTPQSEDNIPNRKQIKNGENATMFWHCGVSNLKLVSRSQN